MIESTIIKLLQQRVTTAVDGKIPVKYLGMNMKKPSNDKYWEVVYIPNNVENEFWGAGKTYRGMMRLLLHWPQNNKGIYEPTRELERVAGYFEKGIELQDSTTNTKVILTDNPDMGGVYEEEGYLLLVLTIRYQCFKM